MEQIWLDVGDFLWFTFKVFGALLIIAFVFKTLQSTFGTVRKNMYNTEQENEDEEKRWMN